MRAGNIGNRHPRLGGLLHHSHLLIRGISTPALDAGKHFNTLRIVRHSRITRLTPSLSLCSYVRSKRGPLQIFPRPAPCEKDIRS